MGGAAVAFPTARTALFYNPAHLSRLQVSRAPVTMLGVSVSISNNVFDQLDFFNKQLQPAIERGIDTLEEAEEQALYNEVFRLGGTPTVVGGEMLLPSFVLNRGTYGFGGGLFAHTTMTYNVEDAGAGVPEVGFSALADFLAVASGGVDFTTLGLKGLSGGITVKYAQRYLSLKTKPVDAIDPDESFYVLGASGLLTDIGLLYEVPFNASPGTLYAGLVLSDIALKDFNYQFSSYWANNEDVRNDAAIAADIALAQARYQVNTTFRAGLAYVLPGVGGPFQETALALDYIQYRDTSTDLPLLGRLSLGLQTTVNNIFLVRAGLNQGYTTLGAGVQLPFVRLDYAFYGSENGRLPGQAASWHHRIQVTLGSF